MEKFFFAITDERDTLAFELFLKTGPRQQELANLHVRRLDVEGDVLATIPGRPVV